MEDSFTADLASPWEQLLTPDTSKQLDHSQVTLVKQKLWEKYLHSFKPVAKESLHHADSGSGHVHHRASSGPSLSAFQGCIEEMKITYFVIGEKPINHGYPLYICLHGGGGTHPSMNDGQWKHMQEYYRDSVLVGVYVAPKGITNTWNLHFVDRSYELYDRLIMYMILCHDVDPNRVYLLGYSAGGDGVYHIAPKMADRWAGANMSAGHPNGVSLVNLYHVPFVIQVGECDSAYNRNKVGPEYGLKLKELRCAHPDGYVNECWLHKGKPHSVPDNDSQQRENLVISDLEAWLKGGENPSCTKRNTNAITWLSQHRRNPIPSHLIWDTGTRAKRRPLHAFEEVTAPSDLFYWLDISGDKSAKARRIEAVISYDSNTVYVKSEPECSFWIRLLLCDGLVDTKRAVVIEMGGVRFTVKLRPSMATMTRTLLERGDPNFMFESEVVLSKAGSEQWQITGTLMSSVS